MTRSLLSLKDLKSKELLDVFARIQSLKSKIIRHKEINILKNMVVGLLFTKPSTRTRTSFEAAVLHLGGKAIYLPSSDLQLKRGEPVKDTARVLGSYLDGLVARVYAHQDIVELAEYSGITVINGLSDLVHPTQAICDLFTIQEVKQKLTGLKLAFVGDGDNVCNSLFLGCAMCGINMIAACPEGYFPNQDILEEGRKIAKNTGGSLEVVTDPAEAVKGADVLYSDVWVSMGDESQKEARLKAFQGYQINSDLLKTANKNAIVMHCLPAHRGLEITDEVIEGPQSVVWQQAANKMYGAVGILDFFLRC